MSEENLSGEIQNTPSHDENAVPSTAPAADAQPQGQAEASATETTEAPKKDNRFQQRINQLTQAKHEAQQKNAALEERLKKLEAIPSAPATPEARVAPNEDDFDTQQDYHAANAKFYADVANDAAMATVAKQNQESSEATKQTQRQDELQTKKEAFEANLEGKRAHFENFEEVAYGNTQFMDLDLAEQIFEMDKGPEIAYHLGSNLDEAARIFAMTPVQRARELTKMEFQVEALKPKVVSDAPDPINPLGNSETIQTDPDKMNADEWQAWRNKQVHG